MENLTKYIFKAPVWWLSIVYIAVIGGIFELIAYFFGIFPQFVGTIIVVPYILSVFTTKLFTIWCINKFTWNRSGLLALSSVIFTLPLLLLAYIPGLNLIFAYIIAMGFTLSIRLFVLSAVVDYRTEHIAVAAFIPVLFQLFALYLIDTTMHFIPAIVSIVFFTVLTLFFLRIFDKPLKREMGLIAMEFVNEYTKILTHESNSIEEYLGKISELVTVPVTTFFFRRSGKKDVWFVVPNLHPGPMSVIGGSNFPHILYNIFKDDAVVVVSHGCASHDLNLISNNETVKIADAIRLSKQDAETASAFYKSLASAPVRSWNGSVSILSQKLGDSLLMVTTRSPEMTEDLDYSIGQIVMREAKSQYTEVGFVDAHNCMVKETKTIYPSTKIGNEYIIGAHNSILSMDNVEQFPLEVGVSHVEFPYSHSDGFGDMGMLALILKAGVTKTAYILFDGNNIQGGVREILRNEILQNGFDECEIMTTDSHIVNTFSGRNPIGQKISVNDILPYVLKGIKEAENDLSPSEVGAASKECNDVRVFGPGKMIQLVSFVSSIVTTLIPFYILFLLIAGLITTIVWLL